MARKLHKTSHIISAFSPTQWIFKANGQWTTKIDMIFAWKLRAQNCNIMDTRNIECVWHALCMAYCCDKQMPGFSMVPNFHYWYCKGNLNLNFNFTNRIFLNWLSGISFIENGFDCNGIYIEFLQNGFEKLLISAGIIRELCSAFPHRKCWGTHWTFAVVNYYSSMPILNFQTLFFKTSGISIFLSDSNETSYGNWKHNEVVI